MTKTSTRCDIPWRRNEVEALHRFLLSARDRASSAFTGFSGDLANVDYSNADFYFSGTTKPPSGAPGALRRNQPFNPLRHFYSVPPRLTPRGSPASDDAGRPSQPRVANICILRGQTGCGKVSAVRRLCGQIGLNIIEYDPFESDVVYMLEDEAYDALRATFLRFMDTVRRKPGLRMSRDSGIPDSSRSGSDAASRRRKRLCLTMGLSSPSTPSDSTPDSSQEPHLILLKDLPRTLATNNPDYVRRIQDLTRSILDGEGCKGGIATYPLLICVNNSSSDRQLLRSILPHNYEKHPRCLRLNVSQITKTKMKSLLQRFLHGLGRPTSALNDQLVDCLSEMSCGDMRFGMCNLHFYAGLKRSSVASARGEMEALRGHMFERSASGAVFNVIGKVLANKRVPVILTAKTDSPAEGRGSPSASPLCHDRFWPCFQLSRPPADGASGDLPELVHVKDDYSDVLEILPMLSEDLSLMPPSAIEFEPPSQDDDVTEALCNAAFLGGPGAAHQELFHGSLLGAMPPPVRLFGLVDLYDPALPLSFCQWPTITGDVSATPARHPRAAHLPRLTRPQVYYDLDALVEGSSVDTSFLVDSVFDNYPPYFESVHDCAALMAHLCFADVYITGYRHANCFGEEAWEQAQRTFACLCARAASCSNLGGTGASGGFRAFNRGVWQSESRHDMKYLQELYAAHLRDLVSTAAGKAPSLHLSSLYTCKSSAFVEIVPFMYMILSPDPLDAVEAESSPLDCSLNMSNIMTESMLERIDMLMSEPPAATPRSAAPPSSSHGSGTPSYNFMDTVTPKFRELLSEIGKHYEGASSRRWSPSTGSLDIEQLQ